MMKKKDPRKALRGAVQVEYAFLLLFVMVPAAAALLYGGRNMYQMYSTLRAAVISSSP